MGNKITKSIIIKLICILVLIVLNIAIIVNKMNVSCDKCTVVIKKHIPGNMQDTFYDLNISELYHALINDVCITGS